MADPYATLGVPSDASPSDIKKAFRQLARKVHPDVAGSDPSAAARFTQIREAYEVLIDPEAREAHDRRVARRAARRSAAERGGFRMPGGFWSNQGFSRRGDPPPGPGSRRPSRGRAQTKHLDLEDIFGDFGSTLGGASASQGAEKTPTQRSGTGPRPPRPEGGMPNGPDPDFGFGTGGFSEGSAGGGATLNQGSAVPPRRADHPGRDITLVVDVPHGTATRGGTVTLHYPRMRRGDDGRTVFRYDEIHDLKVPPGTQHGDTLRVQFMGDAGGDGSIGDLVCDVRVLEQGGSDTVPPGPAGTGPIRESAELVVPVSLAEAVLGGRVVVETASGSVRVTLPPCMRPGARLRIRGRGPKGGDLFVRPEIVLPESLDEESRALMERFAVLNPESPR